MLFTPPIHTLLSPLIHTLLLFTPGLGAVGRRCCYAVGTQPVAVRGRLRGSFVILFTPSYHLLFTPAYYSHRTSERWADAAAMLSELNLSQYAAAFEVRLLFYSRTAAAPPSIVV